MKIQIFVVFLSLIACLAVSAQTADRSVETIRKRYNDIAEKAKLAEEDEEHGQYDQLFMNELVINKLNHQWRAVGIHVLTYKFFYEMKAPEDEDHMYPDQLAMVKVERKESNRIYSEEYLYSKSGALLFFFAKSENDESSPAERRVYFSGIKAIRIVEDGKTRDRLSMKDAAAVKEITSESARIKDIFLRSLKF